MKPPYDITPKILQLVTSIAEKLGMVNANFLNKPSLQLRKKNRIKTILSSLQIEGNTLSEEQITALMENKKVVGPKKDIQEVVNAIMVYEHLSNFKFHSSKSFLKAHAELMNGLVENAGKYRNKGVGIVKGKKVEHMAPPSGNVPFLMKDLFQYLKKSKEISLIKSCVFHYEMEFIHPFIDGNGRMGRLWQTVILMSEYPIFEFLPVEQLVRETQKEYYKALSMSDKMGKSTPFLEYMLDVINQSLDPLLDYNHRILKDIDRLAYFTKLEVKEFTRKDYMDIFKDLSSATASRDLKKGVDLKVLKRVGSKNKSRYVVK